MNLLKSRNILNIFCLFIIYYLIHHLLYGRFNIQNYLIYKYEKRMYEDFNYQLEHNLMMVNKDIYALHYQFDDMVDEVTKRKYSFPIDGEVLIKLD